MMTQNLFFDVLNYIMLAICTENISYQALAEAEKYAEMQ
jgi:hypothetical protein